MARCRFFCLLALHICALPAFAQHRVFTYDGRQVDVWNRFGSSHSVQVIPAPTPGNAKKPQGIGEQVTVIGNFGGTFTINGIGTATSSRSDTLIDITTNEGLTFTAANFTTLLLGGASASAAGNITYEMQIYAGTSSSVGAPLTPAVNGTDGAFDGAGITLAPGSIPANHEVVLRLSRTLHLTQIAEGATTYTATGTIALTIN